MSRKSCYVDFVKEPPVPSVNKATGAIATGADNQEDCVVLHNSGEYFEFIQTGQNDVIHFTKQSDGSFRLPLDNTNGDGIEITQGILSGFAKSFTVGTDPAFFVKACFKVTTRADLDVLQVGFRKLAAYADVTQPSELNAYTDAAWVGINTNAGVLSTNTELNNGGLTSTALAKAALTDGQFLALEVDVSAAGAVTYKVGVSSTTALALANLAVDANAVAFTFDDAEVLVPSIVAVATGASAAEIDWTHFSCGFQDLA